jgi:hypothetical protein
MSESLLKEEVLSFPQEFLERWRNGDYSLLTSANIPSYIKQIIVQKAKIRPGRRFFCETFVAASMSKEIKDGCIGYGWPIPGSIDGRQPGLQNADRFGLEAL